MENENAEEKVQEEKGIIKVLNDVWTYLEGKKRRIALLGAFITFLVPEYTIAYKIAMGISVIFGGSDIVSTIKKK